MIQIIKITIAFIIAFFAFNYVVDMTKTNQPKQKVVVNTDKKKKSLFESPTPNLEKEVVFHLEKGEKLKDDQLFIDTPEGQEQFKKNVNRPTYFPDDNARKQWEIYNKKQEQQLDKEMERLKKENERLCK